MADDRQQVQDPSNPSAGKLLTLGDLLRFLQRRRRTILVTTLVAFLVGIGYCAFATRRYSATTTVEIKRPEDSLGVNRLVQASPQADEQNPLEETVTLSTKVAELESPQLALRVADELGLEKNKDFQHKINLNPLSYFLGLFAKPAPKDAAGTKMMDSPARRDHVAQVFEAHLKVAVVPGTRLITISFSNPDPQVSASVVNTLATDLAQTSFRTRYQAVQQMSSWLSDQLDSVRAQADELEQQEAELRRSTETYNLGGTNAAGQSLVYSPLLDHLQLLTQTLSAAEGNRIVRGAVEQIAQTRDPMLISGLAGSGLASSGNPQSTTSLDEIQKLQGEIDDLSGTVSRDEQRFGDANPKLIQERATLKSLRDAIKSETDRLAARAQNDYVIATKQADSARAERAELMKQADIVNDKELQYEVVHQEAQDARQLYTGLNNRVREAGVLAGLQAADMTVVSAGYAPSQASSPRVIVVLAAALVGGILLGIVLAGIQDVRDDKVNSVDMVESELGIPVYSVLPDFNAPSSLYGYGRYLYGRAKGKDGVGTAPKVESPIHVITETDSQYSEAMRSLRTAILLARTGAAAKTILIASSTPSEGKSTTSVNLAATFSKAGARTLVVEVDLRKPVIARRLGLPPSLDGLSRMLAGQLDRDWVLPVEGVPNLFCIPAGQRPPDPHELISSRMMAELVQHWRDKYDVILLDGPPVLPVIDSVLLSEQADLVLVITRFGRTSINSLRTTHRLLARQVRANVGAVLNAVAQGSEGYYDYYGYRYSDYKYRSSEEAQP